MKDALFLVHPKAKDEAQQALFDKIAKDELAVPYTWEVELSVLGQQKYDSMSIPLFLLLISPVVEPSASY